MSLCFVFAAAAASDNPISVHLWTFILQCVNLVVVVGVLYWLLFRPLSEIMARREETVEKTLAEAAKKHTEAEGLLREYEEQVQAARQKAEEMLESSAGAARDMVEKSRLEAEAEYERMIAQAKSDLEHERQRALADMRGEVADLALHAAGKVLGRSLGEQEHGQLARDLAAKASELQ